MLARHLDPTTHSAWIIGSEAHGTARPGADVDVAVEGAASIPLETLARIRCDLDDLATLRPFDLIDLRRADDRFRREALADALPLVLERESTGVEA